MDWAYGITTVPDRRYNYLPRTVASLKEAGFDKPTLFVDGPLGDYSDYKLEVVHRSSKIRAYGNWLLSLMELWIRHPHAHRFAIFQDDFVTYRNLRIYLEHHELPDDRYWNLYTFPQNEDLKKGLGWYMSNQRGRGAVALVFSNEVVFKLLSHPMIIAKPKSESNPHRNIDGLIITIMAHLLMKEWVHYPTLLQHIGDCSTIGNRQHEKPLSFQGEDFDAINLLHSKLGV